MHKKLFKMIIMCGCYGKVTMVTKIGWQGYDFWEAQGLYYNLMGYY